MTGAAAGPLIVTALLPPDLHAQFTALRRAHFPPERNWLDAHVTLFHALPPSARDEVAMLLKRIARNTPPVRGRVEGIMSLGTGTAIRLSSPAMLALREDIADHFHGALSAQDSHTPRLHVTIQNKVPATTARALQRDLQDRISVREFAFRGLGIYVYRQGPWDRVGNIRFAAAERAFSPLTPRQPPPKCAACRAPICGAAHHGAE